MRGLKSILFTTTAAIAVSASVSAFANGGAYFPPTPAAKPPVAAAAEPGHWFLTLGGLFARPTDSDLSNTTFGEKQSTSNGVAATNTYQLLKLKTQFHWGGYADLGYQFANSPYDVVLGLNGVYGKENNSAGGNLTNIPVFENTHATQAEVKLQTAYFSADLVGRRHFQLNHGIDIAPYAGARFTYLNEKYTLNATDEAEGTSYNNNLEWKTRFWGAGPHIGTIATFPIVAGIYAFGDVHASLLMGTSSNKGAISETYTSEGQSNTNETLYPGDRSTRFVPATGAKIGLGYTADMGNGMSVGVQAGWAGDFYYHAVDNRFLKQNASSLFNPAVANGENRSSFSNFTVAGPFAGIKISG